MNDGILSALPGVKVWALMTSSSCVMASLSSSLLTVNFSCSGFLALSSVSMLYISTVRQNHTERERERERETETETETKTEREREREREKHS